MRPDPLPDENSRRRGNLTPLSRSKTEPNLRLEPTAVMLAQEDALALRQSQPDRDVSVALGLSGRFSKPFCGRCQAPSRRNTDDDCSNVVLCFLGNNGKRSTATFYRYRSALVDFQTVLAREHGWHRQLLCTQVGFAWMLGGEGRVRPLRQRQSE